MSNSSPSEPVEKTETSCKSKPSLEPVSYILIHAHPVQTFQRLFNLSKLSIPDCASDEAVVEFVSDEVHRRTSELSAQELSPSTFEAFAAVLRDKLCFSESYIETLKMAEEALEERFPGMPKI